MNQKIPRIGIICRLLKLHLFTSESLFEILSRFKLNEEVLRICLVKLCEMCTKLDDLNGPLCNLLFFHSSEDKNENLRFIVLEALSKLNTEFFSAIPGCIFNLLLDDDEEIRSEMCRLFNPDDPLNLAQTLRNYIQLVGRERFHEYLGDYIKSHPEKELPIVSKDPILFEKEVLNLFIDPNYLLAKF